MGCPIIEKIKPTLDKWFGLPNEGIHSYKIYDIAYLDFGVTMVGAYIIQKLFLRDTISKLENKHLPDIIA